MTTTTLVVGIALVVVVGTGLFFLYQNGFVDKILNYNNPIPFVSYITNDTSVEGETESSSNVSLVENGLNIGYPTLVPNPRWNHMPIKVYMNASSGETAKGFGDKDLGYARNALKVWQEKTNNVISFDEISDPSQAELVFSWFSDLEQITGGKVVGEGGPTIAVQTGGTFTLIEGGEVFLIPAYDDCLGTNRAVHELGHVLGLGHLPLKSDVMYSRETSCLVNITQTTVDAINQLYKTPAQPDLVITNISALKRGTYMDVNFTVRNIGIVDSSETLMGFVGDGDPITSIMGTQFAVVSGMGPGSGITRSITNIRVPREIGQLTLTVDYMNSVKEMDESNNDARVNFHG